MFKFAEQPLSINKIWKAGLNLYISAFSKMWYLSMLIFCSLIPIIIITIYLIRRYASKIPETLSISTNKTIIIFVIVMLSLLLCYYLYLMLIQRIYQTASASTSSLKNLLKITNNKFCICLLNLIYRWLILTVITGINFIILLYIHKLLFLYIPSISKTLMFVFYLLFFLLLAYIILPLIVSFILNLPLILFENKSAWQAIKIGRQLIKDNFWRTIASIKIPSIIFSIFYAGMVIFRDIIVSVIAKTSHLSDNLMIFFRLFCSIPTELYLILFCLPIGISFVLVQFNDLKLRKKTINIVLQNKYAERETTAS